MEFLKRKKQQNVNICLASNETCDWRELLAFDKCQKLPALNPRAAITEKKYEKK